ncbi:MAG: gluconate 2-dehydrogenase subunit 3 family protein [Terriglobia bacterium]
MSGSETPTRREVLKCLAGAVAAATLARARVLGAAPDPPARASTALAAGTPDASVAHFFAAEEKEMVATVADLIIPTDEVSPGARAAGVQDWIDFLVANSPAEDQRRWREGIVALDEASRRARGKKFLELAGSAQRELLQQLGEREESPATAAERFFVLAKEATVDGYYTSEIGLMQDLKYQGASSVDEPEEACPAPGASPKPPHVVGHAHSAPKGH